MFSFLFTECTVLTYLFVLRQTLTCSDQKEKNMTMLYSVISNSDYYKLFKISIAIHISEQYKSQIEFVCSVKKT